MKRFKKGIALLLSLAAMFALMVSASATMQDVPAGKTPTWNPTSDAIGAPRVIGSGTIKGNGVNVRSGPSTSYPSLGQMFNGEKVGVLHFTKDENSQDPNKIWYYCVCTGPNDGLRGYIYMDYITNIITT